MQKGSTDSRGVGLNSARNYTKGAFYMNTQAVMLAAPYQRQVGKVTFEVTAYADATANQTAEQMLLHLLERQIEKKGEPNA